MKPVRREDVRAALAEVRAVYADLARRPLERQCTALTECCRFRLTGRTPLLTRAEALLVAHAWRAAGRKRLPAPAPGASADGACPMLDQATARCLIYADRPFGCRTHFCRAAGGPAARRDVLDLIRRLEAVDAALGYRDGPRPLASAVGDELALG